MCVVGDFVVYCSYHHACADTVVGALVANSALLEPQRVAGTCTRDSHRTFGNPERLSRDRPISSWNETPDRSSKVDDTDHGENDNAQSPRGRISPASQDQEEEAGAVLKNVLYGSVKSSVARGLDLLSSTRRITVVV